MHSPTPNYLTKIIAMIYPSVKFILFGILPLLLLLIFLFVVTINVVQVAAAKLGFSFGMALFLFALIIFGSKINIPLYRFESQVRIPAKQSQGIPFQLIRLPTVVALNVGGGLIPVLLALYQLGRANVLAIILSTAIVSLVSYRSAVVQGIGIRINYLIVSLTAAVSAFLLTKGIQVPPVAFASGAIGALIGGDLLHLPQIFKAGPGVSSIGGGGGADGIALCGLYALLLSLLIEIGFV